MALSFVGASGAEDLVRVRKLKEKYGRQWPVQWLKERDLMDWAEAWENVDRSLESELWKKEGTVREKAV